MSEGVCRRHAADERFFCGRERRCVDCGHRRTSCTIYAGVICGSLTDVVREDRLRFPVEVSAANRRRSLQCAWRGAYRSIGSAVNRRRSLPTKRFLVGCESPTDDAVARGKAVSVAHHRRELTRRACAGALQQPVSTAVCRRVFHPWTLARSSVGKLPTNVARRCSTDEECGGRSDTTTRTSVGGKVTNGHYPRSMRPLLRVGIKPPTALAVDICSPKCRPRRADGSGCAVICAGSSSPAEVAVRARAQALELRQTPCWPKNKVSAHFADGRRRLSSSCFQTLVTV